MTRRFKFPTAQQSQPTPNPALSLRVRRFLRAAAFLLIMAAAIAAAVGAARYVDNQLFCSRTAHVLTAVKDIRQFVESGDEVDAVWAEFIHRCVFG